MSILSNFLDHCCFNPELSMLLDYSRADVPSQFFQSMEGRAQKAFSFMEELEKGAVANPDEKRMVGHYWLRNSALAPIKEIKDQIEKTNEAIISFAQKVHQGKITNKKGERFKHLLVIGIGGSALGPLFVNQALKSPHDPLDLYLFDNTDPDGMDRVLASIPDLSATLVLVISKSGGTKETRNGQLIAKEVFSKNNLSVENHFVAVTGEGSELDKIAVSQKWLSRFPMWDWVGGRTSEMSAVGLLPAALQGFKISEILSGAKAMDQVTRRPVVKENPAMILALLWYHLGNGKGEKDMVILPYKDRIELFSRYLQQLVMESLGKEHDLNGETVNQGIAVYGNKGSTDQHAYVQQLRDGINNFFVIFINVLKDSVAPCAATNFFVDEGITSGDYLHGFYLGTRQALYEKARKSISITLDQADAKAIGMLIALFERAVGFYASLVNINAYHQPGVEAGKKAATAVLDLQKKVHAIINNSSAPLSVDEIAAEAKADAETVFHIVRKLSANDRIVCVKGTSLFEDKYSPR